MSGSGFLGAATRQAQIVEDVSGRPWPLPEGPWAQAQTREDVLFAHWPVALPERCGAGGHSPIGTGPESTVPRAASGAWGAGLCAATYGPCPAGAAAGEGRA